MKHKRGPFFKSHTLSNIVVVCVGVLFFVLFTNLNVAFETLSGFFAVIRPFIIGLVIAYLLNIPLRFFEKTIFAKFSKKRFFSILLTYILAFMTLVLLTSLLLPQILDSVQLLVQSIPSYLNNLNNLVSYLGESFEIDSEVVDSLFLSYNTLIIDMLDYVGDFTQLVPDLLGITVQVGSGIISALTAFIASVYMLAGKEKLLRQAKRLLYSFFPKSYADETIRIGKLSNKVFSGFISGKLLDSAIIGLICFCFVSVCNFFYLTFGIESLNIPYGLLISIIICVTNIIPFFGPFLGAIPSVMILLMANPWGALWFTIFVIILQQFDGNILGPKILGDSTGIPPIWVLISIIVGGGMFGFPGMVLGVPTTAVLYILVGEFLASRLKKRGLSEYLEDDDNEVQYIEVIPAKEDSLPIPSASDSSPKDEEDIT